MRLTIWEVTAVLWSASRLFSASPTSAAQKLNNEGAAAYTAGRWEESERLFNRALQVGAGTLAPTERATILFNHAAAARSKGMYAEAAREYGETIAIRQQAFGENSAFLTGPLAGLALTLHSMGRLPQAEEHARRAVLLGSGTSPQDQVAAHHSLAQVLLAKAAFAEAGEQAEIALQATRARTVAHAEVLSTLAVIRRNQGNAAEAEAYASEAVLFLENQLGIGHAATATAWNNLAQAKTANGKPKEARVLLVRAIRCFESGPGGRNAHLASSLVNLGYLECQKITRLERNVCLSVPPCWMRHSSVSIAPRPPWMKTTSPMLFPPAVRQRKRYPCSSGHSRCC